MGVETLIVDDSESFSSLLRMKLERIGCEVVGQASNSQEGFESFRSLRPRLVTLDLSMPDDPVFTSLSLLEKIRAEAPETAVVVISVHPRQANAAKFLSKGALLYMEKAFMDFKQLQLELERMFPELKRELSRWRRVVDKRR